MVNNRKTRPLILSLFIVFMYIFIVPKTFSYYDKLQYPRSETIPIGYWIYLNEDVTVTNITNVIDYYFPNNLDLRNYMKKIMFATNAQNQLIMEPVFANYTFTEIMQTLTLIEQHVNQFMTFVNGVATYKSSTAITPFTLTFSPLNPGQSIQIKQFAFTANLNTSTEALNFSITGFAANGMDVSDYAFEVLVDRNALATASPFEYNYIYRQGTTELINWKVQAHKNTLSTIIQALTFSTDIRRTTPAVTLYTHNVQVPTLYGSWSRMPVGPVMYITHPATYEIHKSNTTNGLDTPLSGNGSAIEMNLQMRYLKSPTQTLPEVIPIIINLSRGVSNNGFTLPANNVPSLQIKIYK